MAVAVKNSPETAPAPQRPVNRLAVGSLVGTVYVLGCLAFVFYGLPTLWEMLVTPVIGGATGGSLRFTLMVAAAFGLAHLGSLFVGANPPRGLRAGIFAGIVGTFLAVFITRIVGGILESIIPGAGPTVGVTIVGIVFVALLVLYARFFFKPTFDGWLVALEDQGWFTFAPYKKSQGLLVRRCTTAAIIGLAVCGCWVMRVPLMTAENQTWGIRIPFLGGQELVLLKAIFLSVPFLVFIVTAWFAYRVVNYPVFADFLIATQAELNKVSWTTRKRLIQDTVVVLVTVLLLTTFLFVVDVLWIKILSNRFVGVLPGSDAAVQKQAREQEW